MTKWQESVRDWAKNAELAEVSQDELEGIWERLAHAGKTFDHLPFASLSKLIRHRAGVVKLWPTLKTMSVCAWSDLKWRPLAAYTHNRWKRLYNLVAKWSTFVLEHEGSHFHVASAQAVLGKLHDYNSSLRKVPGFENLSGADFEMNIADISDFFTNVPRDVVADAVAFYVQKLELFYPGYDYF